MNRTLTSAAIAIATLLPTHAFAAGDAAKGKVLFESICSTCHGPDGLGDGPLAATLPADTKPRNLQTGTLKYATDDTKLHTLLKGGGGAVGLSPLMTGAPGVSDDDIDNIIAFIHTLRK